MSIQEILFRLVRMGIGNESTGDLEVVNYPENTDWQAVQDLAAVQGLSAVVVDGVERMPIDKRPPKLVLLQWIGETLQAYEYRFELYRRAIAELADFYNSHGFRMMVLKGYACSLNWPKPEHRPCGDIDIWQFGKFKEADATLSNIKNIQIDRSHFHHTVFYWHDFLVENHFEMVDTCVSRSNAKIEKLFKQLAMDDNYYVDVYGVKVWLPSPDFHALFLLRHATLHFTGVGLNLRQILDWGFFVKANGSRINWSWLNSILTDYGMEKFFYCLNTICIEYFGFNSDCFPKYSYDKSIASRVVNDVIKPEFNAEEPSNIFKRVIFKFRRRKAREWKHNLCYKEPLENHLFSSLWLHITHPDMI